MLPRSIPTTHPLASRHSYAAWRATTPTWLNPLSSTFLTTPSSAKRGPRKSFEPPSTSGSRRKKTLPASSPILWRLYLPSRRMCKLPVCLSYTIFELLRGLVGTNISLQLTHYSLFNYTGIQTLPTLVSHCDVDIFLFVFIPRPIVYDSPFQSIILETTVRSVIQKTLQHGSPWVHTWFHGEASHHRRRSQEKAKGTKGKNGEGKGIKIPIAAGPVGQYGSERHET